MTLNIPLFEAIDTSDTSQSCTFLGSLVIATIHRNISIGWQIIALATIDSSLHPWPMLVPSIIMWSTPVEIARLATLFYSIQPWPLLAVGTHFNCNNVIKHDSLMDETCNFILHFSALQSKTEWIKLNEETSNFILFFPASANLCHQ